VPFEVKRNEQACSASKPWSTRNSETGDVMGCHESEEAAQAQLRALQANVDDEGTRSATALERLSETAEMRSVAFTDVDASADGGTFEGYAAVFDHEADLGDFTESISRGAFRKALSNGTNVPMLYDHNAGLPILATTKSGTLKLEEDAKGLRVRADVAKHFMGDAVRELVKRGDIAGMSFGFVAGRGNSKIENRGGRPHRNLTGFKRLLDVSPTWDEAYSGTDAAFRSLTAIQMAESLEAAQQVLGGASPQPEDGVPQPQAGTNNDEDEGQQLSGVEDALAAAAARRRRLQMMGLSLPKDDLGWMAADDPATRSDPRPRDVDELLRFPRESWSREEQRCVVERRGAVHAEMFALTSEAERTGRNLSTDEVEQFGRLQDEYQRLSR